MDLNKVMLIGRLAQDPETRVLPNGGEVSNFRVATGRKFTDKDGNPQEFSEFTTCVAFAGIAGVVKNYTSKGSRIYVEGRLQSRSWDDKTTGQKRYATEVIVSDVILLDSKNENRPAEVQPEEDEISIENIPF
jgi:single-strand DNA-binding protein